MNIEAIAHGINSDRSKALQVFGPDMPPWQLRQFWRAYQRGGDGRFGQDEFYGMVRAAHLICAWTLVDNNDDGEFEVRTHFGVELMLDEQGLPFVQMTFFERDAAPAGLKDDLTAVVFCCWQMAHLWCESCFEALPARMLIKGRPGWRRMLRRVGVDMSADGWILENQEAFNGSVRRQ